MLVEYKENARVSAFRQPKSRSLPSGLENKKLKNLYFPSS